MSADLHGVRRVAWVREVDDRAAGEPATLLALEGDGDDHAAERELPWGVGACHCRPILIVATQKCLKT